MFLSVLLVSRFPIIQNALEYLNTFWCHTVAYSVFNTYFNKYVKVRWGMITWRTSFSNAVCLLYKNVLHDSSEPENVWHRFKCTNHEENGYLSVPLPSSLSVSPPWSRTETAERIITSPNVHAASRIAFVKTYQIITLRFFHVMDLDPISALRK